MRNGKKCYLEYSKNCTLNRGNLIPGNCKNEIFDIIPVILFLSVC